jgi:hypothetical protein
MSRTLDQSQQEVEWAKLEGLIDRLKDRHDPQARLAVEHMTTARALFLGAMPAECLMNLRYADETAEGLSDDGIKKELRDVIGRLMKSCGG